MSDQLEQARDRLRQSLKRADMTVVDLARSIGRGQDYVRDFLSGRKDSMGAAEVAAIEQTLDVPLGTLFTTQYLYHEPLPSELSKPTHGVLRDLSLASTRQGKMSICSTSDAYEGEFVVHLYPIDVVERPWFMGTVASGFAVIVPDNHFRPVLMQGDLAIVNNRLAPKRGDVVLLVQQGADKENFRATLRTLHDWDRENWHVEPLPFRTRDPEGERLLRSQWGAAWKVVGMVRS